RAEQRREDERRAEHARQDAEHRRKVAEADHDRLMDDVRGGDMERAFARIGRPYPGGTANVRQSAPASPVQGDPWAQAQALERELAGALQLIESDRYLSDVDRRTLAFINEASYLDKIAPLLVNQLEQIERAVAGVGELRLAFDPLGVQRQVQAQRLEE